MISKQLTLLRVILDKMTYIDIKFFILTNKAYVWTFNNYVVLVELFEVEVRGHSKTT